MTIPDLRARLRAAAILPILTVRETATTLRVVEALAEAGVTAVEIVLRTPEAPGAIRAVRERFPGLLVAAGTVTSPETLDAAVATGAGLMISPGLPASLAAHHLDCAIPLVPGVLTPTEVLDAQASGYGVLKYYPAVASNGHVVLEDYANIFPEASFIPTGKIGFDILPAYARLKNVICVGGSWMHSGAPGEIGDKVRRSFDIIAGARDA